VYLWDARVALIFPADDSGLTNAGYGLPNLRNRKSFHRSAEITDQQ